MANFAPRAADGRTFLFNPSNPALRGLGLDAVAPGTLNQTLSVSPIAVLVNQFFRLPPALSLEPSVLGLNLVLPQRELRAPYAFHYGLTVEHQFRDDMMVSAAYVGTRGLGLLRLSTPDRGLNFSRFAGPVGVGRLTPASPFPHFTGQILPPQDDIISGAFTIARTLFESSAQSTYHSLQLEFRKRYQTGLLVGSAFTYSHAIDDASDFFDNAGAFALPQDSVSRSERASSNFDARLRWVTHFISDVPREVFGPVLGRFQLGGVLTAQTGQPYTVNSAFDVNRDGNLTDRLNTTAGILRGGQCENALAQLCLAPGVSARSLLAGEGSAGAVGRNTFRAPSLLTFDMSVTDSFGLWRNARFVTRVEFFNLFNRANYGIPVRILESPGFGRSVRTLTPPRTIQFVGKIQF